MAVIIKIPTWATFNRIPANAPEAGLAALNGVLTQAGLITEPLVVGSFNPVWFDLQDLDLGGGPLTRGSAPMDLAEVTPIENSSFLSMQHVGLALSIGGDVEGYRAYFVIPDINAEVPAFLPNRTYLVYDEQDPEAEPTETAHTWESWYQSGTPNTFPVQIEGVWYGPTSNFQASGELLPASIWYQWIMAGQQIADALPVVEEEV